MYKAKAAVCPDIRTKHSTQSERHVEFLNVKPWRYVKKPLGFKRLMQGSPRRNGQNKIYGGYRRNTPKNVRIATVIYECLSFVRQNRTLYIVGLLGYDTLQ
jgi:hypothetical protein